MSFDQWIGISTAWNGSRQETLGAAVQEIADLGFGLLEIDPVLGPSDVVSAKPALSSLRARPWAVSMGTSSQEPWLLPYLTHHDSEVVLKAERLFEGALKVAAALSSSRLVLFAGMIDLEDRGIRADLIARRAQRGEWENALSAYADTKARLGMARERATEALCRALYPLMKDNPGLVLEFVPSSHPLDILDIESAQWLFGEYENARLRLDPAALILRERFEGRPWSDWAERYAGVIDTLYLSEPHDFRTDLVPGVGALSWPEVFARLSPQTKSMLKVDSACSTVALDQAIRAHRNYRAGIETD